MTEEVLGSSEDVTPKQPAKRKRSDAFFSGLVGTTSAMVVIAIILIVWLTTASAWWLWAAVPFAIVTWACFMSSIEEG